MVLLANARAEDNKTWMEELLNKDEEGVLTETLEKMKDASIDETDVVEDDENAMKLILEEINGLKIHNWFALGSEKEALLSPPPPPRLSFPF